MPTLYVTEPGARIEKEYQRILVTREDEVLLRVPLERLDGLVLVGNVGVTTPALQALLRADISLTIVSRAGRLLGRLLPPTGANVPLRQAQYRCNDESGFALALAQSIVRAKLHNQRVLALRILRRRPDANRAPLVRLRAAENSAQQAATLPELLGAEGMGGRAYLAVYRQAFAREWGFGRRTRRPPTDPVNALLSLGYVLLYQGLMTALEAVGLDPYLGYLHSESRGQPALALDLEEEFRAPFVDSLVMTLVNRRQLCLRDFAVGKNGGIYLKRHGLRCFFSAFSRRLESEIQVAEIGRAISYRKLFEVQARQLAHHISGDGPAYRPFRAR